MFHRIVSRAPRCVSRLPVALRREFACGGGLLHARRRDPAGRGDQRRGRRGIELQARRRPVLPRRDRARRSIPAWISNPAQDTSRPSITAKYAHRQQRPDVRDRYLLLLARHAARRRLRGLRSVARPLRHHASPPPRSARCSATPRAAYRRRVRSTMVSPQPRCSSTRCAPSASSAAPSRRAHRRSTAVTSARKTCGVLQTISGIEANRATRLWELWYDQAFNNGAFDIKVGQQSLDQEFITSTGSSLYVEHDDGLAAHPVGRSICRRPGLPAVLARRAHQGARSSRIPHRRCSASSTTTRRAGRSTTIHKPAVIEAAGTLLQLEHRSA